MWKCSSCGNWSSDSLMVCPTCLANPINKTDIPTEVMILYKLGPYLLAKTDVSNWFMLNNKEESNE